MRTILSNLIFNRADIRIRLCKKPHHPFYTLQLVCHWCSEDITEFKTVLTCLRPAKHIIQYIFSYRISAESRLVSGILYIIALQIYIIIVKFNALYTLYIIVFVHEEIFNYILHAFRAKVLGMLPTTHESSKNIYRKRAYEIMTKSSISYRLYQYVGYVVTFSTPHISSMARNLENYHVIRCTPIMKLLLPRRLLFEMVQIRQLIID